LTKLLPVGFDLHRLCFAPRFVNRSEISRLLPLRGVLPPWHVQVPRDVRYWVL
jgi:hypothetical protein